MPVHDFGMKHAVALLAALSLSACAVQDPPSAAAPAEGEFGYSAKAAASCASQGGTYARRGMMGAYSCAVPFADAGKSCTDSTQCEGQCRVEMTEPQPISGQCQATTDPFGCHGFFDDNGEYAAICVD